MNIIALEYKFEKRRRELHKKVKKFKAVERNIQDLFDRAHDLNNNGAISDEINSVLRKVKDIGRRYGFFKDQILEEEDDETG